MIVPDVEKALEFYRKALGGVPSECLRSLDGKTILHGEMRLGDSRVMLSPENPEWGSKAPSTLGGSPVSMHVYLPDADAAFRRAVDAGCEIACPMEDAFWGDRYGKVTDPFGHSWGLATRREALTLAEIETRGHAWRRKLAPAS